ncbi:MAG: DUF262 domain-containing protein [Rhodobacteraceae bacterium]|nr:DUF262 domain-containing protein [Paracoccaceae bacterium]
MKSFDARAYSISDFLEWHQDKKLELSPKFQRRSVWSNTAKAFLADTIIRGKPFPKVIFMQKFVDGKTVRVVVDGQQRLRAIIDFVNDGIKLSKAHNPEYAGFVFSDLPEQVKNDFLSYNVGCDVLGESPTSELLDIFARINRYSVKLNAQELRNANFSGYFKTTAFNLGYEYVDYWLETNVLTQSSINRMGEAELASDLLVMFVDKIHSNKAIERFYKEHEENEGNVPEAAEKLRETLKVLSSIFPVEELNQSAWRRKHLYYSLVSVIGHILFGIPNLYRSNIGKDVFREKAKLQAILNSIGSDHERYTPQPMRASAPPELTDFIRNSTLATTDTKARIERAKFILERLEAEVAA